MDMVGTSASEQVIQTVAEQSDTGALDLPPLFDTLDPDSLDTLIRELDEGKVTFGYAGYNIFRQYERSTRSGGTAPIG